MLRQIAARVVTTGQQRFLHTSIARLTTGTHQKTYSPNNLEKRFLVWSGKYKNTNDIPSHISQEEMERCRNKVRIRMANIMILLTIVGCGIMVYSGKQAAKRGDSVAKQNLDWHKHYNAQKEQEKSKSAD